MTSRGCPLMYKICTSWLEHQRSSQNHPTHKCYDQAKEPQKH